MMTLLYQELERSLPLLIERVGWESEVLSLGGPGWSFRILGSWRLCENGIIRVGSDDKKARDVLESCVGASLLNAGGSESAETIDPSFYLSNGLKLEVFSSSVGETWTMRLPSTDLYFVAEPSDPAHLR